VSQLVQQGFLKASNPNPDDNFGLTVAISGDTLVVGAPDEDSNAVGVDGDQTNNGSSNSGAVYVFTRTGGLWTQQAYLKASDTNTSDQFGYSVAISGDTIAVGAPAEDSDGVNGNQTNTNAPASGAVYIFTRAAGVWTQQAYIKASNPGADDQFGNNLALAGDTLAVGALYEDGNGNDQADNSATDAGAVYVFTRTGTNWSQQAYVKPDAVVANSLFGYGIALSGDTLAVGAPFETNEAGAAYVFVRTGGVWTQQANLHASNAEAGDRFGLGMGIDGDTLVAGARFEKSAANVVNGDQTDNSAVNAGAAYVFTRTGTSWSQQAYLKASNAGADKNFGGSVAVKGDIVAVGSRLEDSNATGINGDQANNSAQDSGAVYLFTRSGGVWTQAAYLKASNTAIGDQFGVSVALSDDSLAVGAELQAGGSGAAYVFAGGAL
jgi:hypothetical protein